MSNLKLIQVTSLKVEICFPGIGFISLFWVDLTCPKPENSHKFQRHAVMQTCKRTREAQR